MKRYLHRNFLPLLLAVGLCLALAPPGLADYRSYILDFGGSGVTSWSGGGTGVGSVYHEDSGVWSGGDYTINFWGSTRSSANLGQMAMDLHYTITNSAAYPRGGGYGYADTYFWDYFTIGPGTSGLSAGDPAKVRFHATLDGWVVLHGVPSGGAWLGYNSYLDLTGPGGGRLATADWNAGVGWYPPQNFFLHQEWDQIVDVHIGDLLYLYGYMSTDLNGSSHAGGAVETNYLDFTTIPASARLGFAPGFENISITSDAGAPLFVELTPIPGTLLLLGGDWRVWRWWAGGSKRFNPTLY